MTVIAVVGAGLAALLVGMILFQLAQVAGAIMPRRTPLPIIVFAIGVLWTIGATVTVFRSVYNWIA